MNIHDFCEKAGLGLTYQPISDNPELLGTPVDWLEVHHWRVTLRVEDREAHFFVSTDCPSFNTFTGQVFLELLYQQAKTYIRHGGSLPFRPMYPANHWVYMEVTTEKLRKLFGPLLFDSFVRELHPHEVTA